MDKIEQVLQSMDFDYVALKGGLAELVANERIPQQSRLGETKHVARRIRLLLATFEHNKLILERTNIDKPL